MEHKAPKTLDYLGLSPQERPQINVPAAVSLGCGLAAAVFMLSMLAGVWQHLVPGFTRYAAFVSGALAVAAIINGAIGALRSPRDSAWFKAALFGYGTGLLVACLTPVFFLL